MRLAFPVAPLLGLALLASACDSPRTPSGAAPASTPAGPAPDAAPDAAPAATDPETDAADADQAVRAREQAAFLSPDSPAFSRHPATMFTGPLAAPVITGPFRTYRTRIRDAGAGGVNFAGAYTLLRFGCGTGCTSAIVIDRRDGALLDFPLGGEDYYALQLTVRPDSKLVRSTWETSYPDRDCVMESWVWADGRLTSLGDRRSYPADSEAGCPFRTGG